MLNFLLIITLTISLVSGVAYDCTTLLMGQFLCPDPGRNQIDPKTQQFYGCDQTGQAKGENNGTKVQE